MIRCAFYFFMTCDGLFDGYYLTVTYSFIKNGIKFNFYKYL